MRKRDDKFNNSKSSLKNGAVFIEMFSYMKMKRLFKKRITREARPRHKLSSTKKIFDFIFHYDRVLLALRR